MLKDFIVHVRYPYTAGIIAIIWVGTAFFMVIDKTANVQQMLILNAIITTIVAFVGFSNPRT